MADPKTQTACEENPKVGFGAYIALALAIIIFSGVFYKMPDAYKWLGAFDYTTLIGKYGTIAGTASNCQGSGGCQRNLIRPAQQHFKLRLCDK